MLFGRWRQRVLQWGYIGATWQIRLNLCILWPTRVHNPNGTSIGSAVFAQMTVECPYALQWFACFPLKIAPSHVGIWTSVVTVSKFFLSVGFGRFCRKNLGFRFGLGFHDKHVVNFFMTCVYTVSSTRAEYSCKPNANHVTPLDDAKGELATEF